MTEKKCWSKDETFSLITQWKLYPELWDIKSKNYRNRIKKQNAFKVLAVKFDTVESEVSRKLHNLRTQFHQELRRMKTKKSGDGADDVYIAWEYFNEMKFISCDHSDPTIVDNLVNVNNEAKHSTLEPPSKKPKPDPKMQILKEAFGILKSAAENPAENPAPIQQMKDENPELKSFCDFIYHKLKNFNKQRMNLVQQEILQIIFRSDQGDSD